MLTLILVRHGETDWNAAEIFRGGVDVALNETGVKQAQLLGEYLSGLKINAIYTSPLQRALTTAQAIAGCQEGVPPVVAAELTDLNYGFWQGLTHEMAKAKYPDLYLKWQ
jgi:broad specificity phosphatase PhoE